MIILYAIVGKSTFYNPNQTLISIIKNKITAEEILDKLNKYNLTRPIYCGLSDTADAKEYGERLLDWSKHHPVFDKNIKTSFNNITMLFESYEIIECGLIEDIIPS